MLAIFAFFDIIKSMLDLNLFWADAKNQLSISMNAISYEVWIDKLEPVCVVGGKTLVLLTISETSKRTIDMRHLDKIREVVSSINSSITDVVIITPDKKDEFLKNQSIFIEDEGFIATSVDVNRAKKKNPFLPKYTFETFIEGKSNAYALAAAKTVAEEPGLQYNPLFIYSGVGLGKTHLLHAIGNYVYKNKPEKTVLYVSADTLITEFLSIMHPKSRDDAMKLREKYTSCDILMVDDIQSLINKEATQELFFNVFNDLYHRSKQIILTSDRAPKDLTTLEDRLRTRFSCGLTVDIQIPDTETRVAILKDKAAQAKFALSDEVAEFIAERSTTNIREMEGLLNKIVFFSSLANRVIDTKELAYEALSDFIEDKKETIDASDIVNAVCKYFNISPAEIVSSRRTKNIVEPRMIAIYLITELLPMPLAQIGEMFGGKDHTTIIHARDKISEEIATNPRIKIAVADLKNMLLNR